MTDYLRLVYRVLDYSIGVIILVALITDAMGPHSKVPSRIVVLILIGIEALVWVWLSKKVRRMI